MLILLATATLLAQPHEGMTPGWMYDAHRARLMSMAVHVYAQEHDNQLPPDLASMTRYLMGDDVGTAAQRAAAYRDSFLSSQDQGVKVPDNVTPEWANEHSSFTYLAKPNIKLDDLPTWDDLAILHIKFDKAVPTEPSPTNPEGRIYTVSFVDGHTEAMNRADAERVVNESAAIYQALSTGKPLPDGPQTLINLRTIVRGIKAYAKAHNDELPPDLGSTLAFIPNDPKFLPSAAAMARVFLSPEAQKSTHIPDEPTPEWINEHASYIYLGGAKIRGSEIQGCDNVIILHGRLDAPVTTPRRGSALPVFPSITWDQVGRFYEERYTRWIMDVSKRVMESARSGAPLPDHLNALRDARRLTHAIIAYAAAHNNSLPPDLGATLEFLKLDDHVTARDRALVYLSPRAERATGVPEAVTREWINRYSDYTYLGSEVDRKLVLEAGVQYILHGPLDEAWDIMDRGTDVRGIVVGHAFGGAFLMDEESARAQVAQSKESLDAIRAGANR